MLESKRVCLLCAIIFKYLAVYLLCMCTVTYIPDGKGNFVFTSSRDESPLRKTLVPKKYEEKGVFLLYPKDVVAGGSWILLSEKERLVCLMNGMDSNPSSSYAKSRGVLVKDLATSQDVCEDLNHIDFSDFAPFTCIVLDWSLASFGLEIVWDGSVLQQQELGTTPRIWSSTSLYSKAVRKERELWFQTWLSEQYMATEISVLSFHDNITKGNSATAIRMKRSKVETVSITCIEKQTAGVSMEYFDLLTSEQTKASFEKELDAAIV